MKKLKLLLAILSFGSFLTSCSNDDDATPIDDETLDDTVVSIFETIEDNPDAVLLYQGTVQITGIETFGSEFTDPVPSEGRRTNFNFAGPVTGQISGDLVGVDYATIFPNGDLSLDIFGTITTTDGATLAINYRGLSAATGAATATLTETGTISSNHPNYSYLNNMHIVTVGTADNSTQTLEVSVYGFEQDPFNGDDPYAEAVDTVDYANFPYTFESIASDPNGTLVYEATVTTTGLEGFGANPVDLLSGNVPTEGARVDAIFEGTTNGEITGNLSGTDFLVAYPDTSLRLNVRGEIETTEGAKISLKVLGRSLPSNEPGVANLFETIELRSNHPDYQYLNNQYVIGVGISNAATNTLTLRLYRFDENPLN